MKKRNTLHLKKTSRKELAEKWGFEPMLLASPDIYIRCTAKGIVNWETSSVYSAKELVGRYNVKILE